MISLNILLYYDVAFLVYFETRIDFFFILVVFINTLFFIIFFDLVCKYSIDSFKNIAIAFFDLTSLTSPYFLLWQMLLIFLLHYLYIALLLLIAF